MFPFAQPVRHPTAACVFDADLIRRLDRNGPRYTSYPTADRFQASYPAETYRGWAARRNQGGIARPLSLYVHIPFCGTICFYCGCNKVVTRDRSKAEHYLRYLERETALQADVVRGGAKVDQLHLGGGTPTYLKPEQIGALMRTLRERFEFSPSLEGSIEIDPRTVNPETIAALGAQGFNRMSLGVQDFDPEVQRAINRIQSEDETAAAIEAGRANGFGSINVDLIYGLPKQTLASVARTLERVIELGADRIAFYNYAHLPALFKPQRRIAEADLPSPETKLQMLGEAIRRLTAAGYVHIGMDHFARPQDELAVAQRQGRLHRNFQGYSTHAECDLVGLGASAIGMLGPTYYQNFRALNDYYAPLERNELPIMRGFEMSPDDLVRRCVIQALMCHFELCKESIETAWLIDFDDYFAQELAELAALEAEGLLELDRHWISVTPRGRLLIRSICMVFDRYLRADQERRRYSKVI
ncbi:MAG: oxygen-independent coproporphyrinogen III oxidase [Betaproteobacteria bacterium]|nr:MAG: oxygen-independent coproporphyrinogen III oxidase [Betaproteobacteria bacterium]